MGEIEPIHEYWFPCIPVSSRRLKSDPVPRTALSRTWKNGVEKVSKRSRNLRTQNRGGGGSNLLAKSISTPGLGGWPCLSFS
ncbi:hypothetical protein I7I53_06867 [Histoplasma capsulatum var. duboisii H88]|uniref:Uncharacterized protein n=1 Tax=Ajellomyces capsulatus (strain H88) TaxID=544711 RepID=A0A8A1LHR7_AJEC8|nr:hypothetical protein I7I53_06867 [Histoplasma capsulatum var. duboisii H88]